MPDIYDWSTTAADNDDADSTINWLEGQAPSTVNNSARAVMKRVAELLDDIGAVGTVGGTADAITVTSAIATLATGKLVAFKAASANTGAATLNVNGLGAKAIRHKGDTALLAGQIAANGIYLCRYDADYNTAAGAWVVLTPQAYGPMDTPLFQGINLYHASSAVPSTVVGSASAGTGLRMNDDGGGGLQPWPEIVHSAGIAAAFKAGSTILLDPVTLTGGQIVFPATQSASGNANTLDDYEEGTTTPTPTAGSGTFTSVAATLSYTKVGNNVQWNATITITTNGTAASHVILPMPFTCGAQAAAVRGVRADNGTTVGGRIAAAGTTAVIWLYDGTYPGATGATITVGGSFNV